MNEDGALLYGMWNYCVKCRVEWHTRDVPTECDLCHTEDILHSEFNKIEGKPYI